MRYKYEPINLTHLNYYVTIDSVHEHIAYLDQLREILDHLEKNPKPSAW